MHPQRRYTDPLTTDSMQGCVLIENCASDDEHRGFEQMLFDSPPGTSDNDNDFPIRLILSSYWWYNGSTGIPDGLSDCSRCTITCQGCMTTPFMPAYDASSTGYDKPGYTRCHRDAQIISSMRSWMHI